MTVRMIVATDPTGLMGITREGSKPTMPWHYKEDLKRFKRLTMGGTLIMGRITFESLPGVLPGRPHIILSRTPGYGVALPPAVSITNDLGIALMCAKTPDTWICGGKQIYELALASGKVAEIDHTFVPTVNFDEPVVENEASFEAVQFDLSVLDKWELVEEQRNPKDDRLTHRRYRCPLPASNS